MGGPAVKESNNNICESCDLKLDIDELRRSDREQNQKIEKLGEKIDKLTEEIKNGFAKKIAQSTIDLLVMKEKAETEESQAKSYAIKAKWTIAQKVVLWLVGLLAATGPVITWLLSR